MDASACHSSKQDKEKPYIEPNPQGEWNKDSADGGWSPKKAPVLFAPGKKSASSNFKNPQAKVVITNSKAIPAPVVRSSVGLTLPQTPSRSEDTFNPSASSIDKFALDRKKTVESSKVIDDSPDPGIQPGSGLTPSQTSVTTETSVSHHGSSTFESADKKMVLGSSDGAGGAGRNITRSCIAEHQGSEVEELALP